MNKAIEFILSPDYECGNEVHGALFVNGKVVVSSRYWKTVSIIEAEKKALKILDEEK
jgi:hypothetical protein